jgi:tetratricopeptide (TPR) repeat protein
MDASRRLQQAAGTLVVLLSLVAMIHSVRAAVAASLYQRARYGPASRDIEQVLRLCERAHALYPYDYYVCIWAGKQAWAAWRDSGPDSAESRLSASREWATRGMAINPHNSELTHLYTEHLALTDPNAALAVWQPYVQRRFWDPFNHAFLVDLLVRAGRIDEAEESLYWVKDSPLFEPTRRMLDAAWLRHAHE